MQGKDNLTFSPREMRRDITLTDRVSSLPKTLLFYGLREVLRRLFVQHPRENTSSGLLFTSV